MASAVAETWAAAAGEAAQAVRECLRRISFHRQPVGERQVERRFDRRGLGAAKLLFQELLDRLGIRDRAPERQLECAPVRGLVAAREGNDLLGARHRADGAEQAEGVAGVEHADLQHPDHVHPFGSRLLPELHQCILEQLPRH